MYLLTAKKMTFFNLIVEDSDYSKSISIKLKGGQVDVQLTLIPTVFLPCTLSSNVCFTPTVTCRISAELLSSNASN